MPHMFPSFLIVLFFIVFAVVFIYVVVKIISEWVNNRNSPVLEREAVVEELFTREETSMIPIGADGAMMPTSETLYYVRFRLADGSHPDYKISRKLWNSLRTGTQGTLVTQGTWFKGFTPS